jgi:hypothetical protein
MDCSSSLCQIGSIGQLAILLVGSGGFLLAVANTCANIFLQSQAINQNQVQTASLYMLALRGGLSLGNLATGVLISFSSVHVAFIYEQSVRNRGSGWPVIIICPCTFSIICSQIFAGKLRSA